MISPQLLTIIESEIQELPDNLRNILESQFLIYTEGTWLSGVSAVYMMLRKEYPNQNINRDFMRDKIEMFFSGYIKMEKMREKHGFFDGTKSLISILKSQNENCHLDDFYFYEFSRFQKWARLKTANKLYYAKQLESELLMKKAINNSLSAIHAFFENNTIDALLCIPPTKKRNIQFRDVIQETLGTNIRWIETNKHVCSHENIEQKQLTAKERIENAEVSISIIFPDDINTMKHIVMFDDNCMTGSTLNAVAKKIRTHGYTGKITAITITGNIEYNEGETNKEEI